MQPLANNSIQMCLVSSSRLNAIIIIKGLSSQHVNEGKLPCLQDQNMMKVELFNLTRSPRSHEERGVMNKEALCLPVASWKK